jgi:hypothetical protein
MKPHEWFPAIYMPVCRNCSNGPAEWKVTDGMSSDYPYCEKCATAKAADLNTRLASREHSGSGNAS